MRPPPGTIRLRPILGFGPAGWLLLPIALALAWSLVVGYDLRFDIQRVIHETWGWKATVSFVTSILAAGSVQLWDPIPSPISLMWLLLALFIQPRRVPTWAWLGLSMFCMTFPNIVWESFLAIGSKSVSVSDVQQVAWALSCVGFCALHWWLARARLPLVLLVLAFAPAFVLLRVRMLPGSPTGLARFISGTEWVATCVWHVVMASLFVGYAIAQRRFVAALPALGCPACGYDRSGLGAGVICPECGAAAPASSNAGGNGANAGLYTALMTIDTKNVARRKLRFGTLDDMLAEAQRIADADKAGRLERLGNWTVGQNFAHLAAFIDYGYDGYPPPFAKAPWFVKLAMKFLRERFLEKGLPQGVKIPKLPGGTTGADDVSTQVGHERLVRAAARLRERVPPIPSAAFGPMSHEDSIRLALRHAELHLGFLNYA